MNQLKRIIWNLLNNAVQALPSGGTIGLRVDSVAQGSRPVAEIKVSDDGCGMDKETADRVFDPFFTTKEQGEGTGLGLSITHQLVTRHSGEIARLAAPLLSNCSAANRA